MSIVTVKLENKMVVDLRHEGFFIWLIGNVKALDGGCVEIKEMSCIPYFSGTGKLKDVVWGVEDIEAIQSGAYFLTLDHGI